MAVVLPVLSFFSIALCTAPLILHGKNRNIPATSLICWCIILNLFNIINALIWPTDDTASWWDGTGLCDVEVKIMVASYVAVPGALVGIFRGLAIVMDTNRATWVPSKAQRCRNRLFDLLFCVVVPCIAMITHIVWQKNRYYLFSISGCVSDFDESWVSFVLAWIWPPIICLIAGYYCCKFVTSHALYEIKLTLFIGLVLIRLYRYRSDFVHILRSRGSNMNKSGFLRLFFLAFTMLLAILPVQAYVIYYDVKLSLPWHPYSWSNIHGPDWYKIIKVPAYGSVFFDRWTPIASGFMIFIFFGFGRDATSMYRTLFWTLGLGYCFPGVARPLDSQATASVPHANASNSTTLVDSTRSRVKLLFKHKSSSSPYVCVFPQLL